MTAPESRLVAVLDMGASAVRLAIAEIDLPARARIIEEASKGVLLGRDTFSFGAIRSHTIDGERMQFGRRPPCFREPAKRLSLRRRAPVVNGPTRTSSPLEATRDALDLPIRYGIPELAATSARGTEPAA